MFSDAPATEESTACSAPTVPRFTTTTAEAAEKHVDEADGAGHESNPQVRDIGNDSAGIETNISQRAPSTPTMTRCATTTAETADQSVDEADGQGQDSHLQVGDIGDNSEQDRIHSAEWFFEEDEGSQQVPSYCGSRCKCNDMSLKDIKKSLDTPAAREFLMSQGQENDDIDNDV